MFVPLRPSSQYDARRCDASRRPRVDACRDALQREDRLESYPRVPLRHVHASDQKISLIPQIFAIRENLTRRNASPCVNIVNQP